MPATALIVTLLFGCGGADPAFKRPNAVEVGADGQIYVSDFHNQRIVEFGEDGSFVRSFGTQGLGRGHLWQAWGITAEDDGSLLALNMRPLQMGDEGEQVMEIKRFRDGREVSATLLLGPGGENIAVAEGIAAMPGGGYLVVNSGKGRLHRYDNDFRFVETWAWAGRSDEFASGVARDGDDVWVVEQYSHRFRRIGADGRELLEFTREGDTPDKVSFPKNIDVCPGRWLAVADLGNHRVQRFDVDGRFVGGFAPEPRGEHLPVQIMDVAVSASCERIWVADSKGNRVLGMSVDGDVETEIRRW